MYGFVHTGKAVPYHMVCLIPPHPTVPMVIFSFVNKIHIQFAHLNSYSLLFADAQIFWDHYLMTVRLVAGKSVDLISNRRNTV